MRTISLLFGSPVVGQIMIFGSKQCIGSDGSMTNA